MLKETDLRALECWNEQRLSAKFPGAKFNAKMTPEQKKEISSFLLSVLNVTEDIHFVFKEDPSLLSGVELQTGEQVMSWNMRRYLNQFETNLDAAITGLIQEE